MYPRQAIDDDPLRGDGRVFRTALRLEELLSPGPAPRVDLTAFALPANAAPPDRVIEGTLTLAGLSVPQGVQFFRDRFGLAASPGRLRLPRIQIGLIQHGSHLIPTEAGLIYTGSPFWNLLVEPGRTWREIGDRGWQRAALPFALVARNQNATHHGVLTFLFNGRYASEVRFQISQETCAYFQFDLWGRVHSRFVAHPVPGAAELRDRAARERAARLPTRPLEALAHDYPDSSIDLSVFGAGLTPTHRSAFGLLYGGVHYAAPSMTRAGAHPFPDQLRLPSYSVAKSLYAAVALLRLAQRYGPEMAEESLGRLLPGGAGWADVTLIDALDMATGRYLSPEYMVDEDSDTMSGGFFLPESAAARRAWTLQTPWQTDPGRRWVYRSCDTFLLTEALDALTKRREGIDLFRLVCDEVYAPAGVSAGGQTILRTDNRVSGSPVGGYGLFLTTDDVLKLASLLHNDSGRMGGAALLHKGLLAAALQRDPARRGLVTAGPFPYRYQHGFWALPSPGNRWTVFLSGFGGILIGLLPGGGIYYHFSDNDEFPSLLPIVAQTDRLPG